MIKFLKKLKDSQTTEVLKEETHKLVNEVTIKHDKVEKGLQLGIDDLNKLCVSLQEQINEINVKTKAKEKVLTDKAKESLLTETDFNFDDKTNVRTTKDKKANYNDFLGNICESDGVEYVSNLTTERFQEPRMFTMKQIRNVFFACLNQSTIVERVGDNELRHKRVDLTTKNLNEVDNAIQDDINKKHTILQDKIAKFKKDHSKL